MPLHSVRSEANLDNLPNEIILNYILVHFSIPQRFQLRRLNQKWRRLSLTGVDKLSVGCLIQANDFISLNYEMQTWNDRSNGRMFEILIKEGGHFLKSLCIQIGSVESWSGILSNISLFCPNITKLGIRLSSSELEYESILSLFQHYGYQLEMAYLFFYFLNPNNELGNSIIQHLNPERLRSLYLCPINQSNLNTIAKTFPLLKKIGFQFGIDKDRLNFDCIQKLTQLEEVFCQSQLSDYSFCSLIRPLIACRLQKLHLSSLGNIPVSSSSFELMFKLIELPCLTILSLKCEKFFYGVNALKGLKELELGIELEGWNDQRLKTFLHPMSQLNQLNKLELRFYDLDKKRFSLDFFRPMPTVANLNIQLFSDFETLYKKPIDVQILPSVFPNVVHLKLESGGLPTNALLECIENLPKLKSLELDYHKCNLRKVKNMCDSKEIVLKNLYLQFNFDEDF